MDIPTPPASSIAPSTHPNPLPQPRKHALKPGCPKESNLINYLDRTLDNIRYKIRHKTWDKKHAHAHDHDPPSPKRKRLNKQGDHASEETEKTPQGYQTFVPLAHDLEQIIDVVWVSSSPNLQIPYLLTITSIIIDSLPLFGPMPFPSPAYASILVLLEKLDFAFSALLVGKDPDTGGVLPGFETGRKVSATERVRVKSAVERARMVALEVLGDEQDNEVGERVVEEVSDSGDEGDDEGDDVEEMDGMGGAAGRGKEGDDGMLRFEGFDNDDEEGVGDAGGEDDADQRRKALGRVFERTLGELGDMLGGLEPIGIDTGN